MATKSVPDMEQIEIGDEIIAWETWEYPPQERSRNWYIIASVIGVALVLYAVYSANYLFAIVVLMLGVELLLLTLRKPNRVTVYITNLGVAVGPNFYPYEDINDFSIVYKPPVKLLYLSFKSMWRPLISVPLEEENPNGIREALMPYCFENLEREEEDLTDVLRRLYKF